MSILQQYKPQNVFKYFEEISAIPRGSGNMDRISAYCMEFAKKHSLRAICDDTKNVIIYKDATKGYEACEHVILQGHLDMVCQKTSTSAVDFEKDGISIKAEGDIISADGTTLGADNGIAVAMILAILESTDLSHPAIEAVFTVDEEIGMLGALALDPSHLTAKRMINLDSEEEACMTVSCAGGSDFGAKLSLNRENKYGFEILVTLKGLLGGHSGICIHEGRVNANILVGRFLKMLSDKTDFDIISVNGGDKANAIPPIGEMHFCADNPSDFESIAKQVLSDLKKEISAREPSFAFDIVTGKKDTYSVFSGKDKENLIYALVCTPNGVIDMSKDIEGLVETSLNLGILQTDEEFIRFGYALRSNKKSALRFLEKKMTVLFSRIPSDTTISGAYPPWEFNKNSKLQKIYQQEYARAYGKEVLIEAIHAGLECGVFADKIPNFDGIAIGPELADVHTVDEHMSAASVARIYSLLTAVLENCK